MRTRPAQPADRERLADLWQRTFPQLAGRDPLASAGAAHGSVLVGEVGSEVVAAAVVAPVPDEPQSRRLQVLAEDDAHWRAVHTTAVQRVQREGATRWYAVVREDSTAVLDRLRAEGYRVTARSWGAHLHLDDGGVEELRRLRDRVLDGSTGSGRHGALTLRRLTAEDADAAHALLATHHGDFPAGPATCPEARTPQQVAALLDGAHAHGLWEGSHLRALTVVRRTGPAAAETEVTVTDRSSRGRGFATAVKAHAVLDLAADGVRRFSTGGAEVNEASLRANRRLGYELEPLWLTLVLTPRLSSR